MFEMTHFKSIERREWKGKIRFLRLNPTLSVDLFFRAPFQIQISYNSSNFFLQIAAVTLV